MAKRGRKPGFKLAWRSTTSGTSGSTWYQDFRNLIHYARYHGNATEIKFDQLEKELQREITWMNEKKEELENLERIGDIIAEKKDERLSRVIGDEYRRKQQEHKDSLSWFAFLNSCIEEYKKWERSTKNGIIQQ